MVRTDFRSKIISLIRNRKILRNAIYSLADKRAKNIVNQINKYLKADALILDFGSGTCNICEILRKKGYTIIPLDINNYSFVDGLDPVIYDGTNVPFETDAFDVALILTVLHHTNNPYHIIKEVMRVSKRMIIMEDIYTNPVQKFFTHLIDSLLSIEFIGHPHSNLSDENWKRLFNTMGLELKGSSYSRTLILRHVIYYIEKGGTEPQYESTPDPARL